MQVSTRAASAGTRLRKTALRLTLANARWIPARVRFPLQRDGVDPVPLLRQTRERGPIVRLATLLGTRIWLVTGYDAAREVLADSESWANDVRHLIRSPGGTPAEQIGGLGMTDPPEHTRLRRVLTPYFTRHRLRDLQGAVDRVVADALDDLAAGGPRVDLVAGFAFAVPFGVICDLLGMPEVDRADFRRLGTARFDLRSGGPGIFGTAASTRQFLIDLVARERAEPSLRDGLISRLVAEHGHELDNAEIGGLADGVFLGGYETSASMLALGVHVLGSAPDAWRALQEGAPAEVDRVVEELLRYICPVQVAFPRFARRDVMVGDTLVRSGDVVVVSLTGAGRDPARHASAELFDPTSDAAATLAFGHGLHRCVGAELARMELRTALVALARRFPDMRPAGDPADLRFTELSIVHGVEELPMLLWPSEAHASGTPT